MLAKTDFTKAKYHYWALEVASTIKSGGPRETVTVLYSELLYSLDLIEIDLVQNQALSRSNDVKRARAILIALMIMLDFSEDGPLSDLLETTYRSMMEQFEKIIVANDSQALANLREGVASLSKAWRSMP